MLHLTWNQGSYSAVITMLLPMEVVSKREFMTEKFRCLPTWMLQVDLK